MIGIATALGAINKVRSDAVVVSGAFLSGQHAEISLRRDLDIDLLDCEGNIGAVGLGVAISQEYRKTFIFDQTKSLRRNLNSLVTIGSVAPSNLIHFLFIYDSYSEASDNPNVTGTSNWLASLAYSAGYLDVVTVHDIESLTIVLPDILAKRGPVLVSIKLSSDICSLKRPSRDMRESFHEVKHTLAIINHRGGEVAFN